MKRSIFAGGKHRPLHLRRALPNAEHRVTLHLFADHDDAPASDLSPKLGPALDQGERGTCFAFAGAAAVEVLTGVRGSPQFVQWATRVKLDHEDPAEDSGATNHDLARALETYGLCPEAADPYDPAKFADAPPDAAWTEAAKCKVTKSVNTAAWQVPGILAAGHAVVMGMTVFASMESDDVARTGIVPMPAHGETQLGGHDVLLTGWDPALRRFRFRNSWGGAWGDAGDGHLEEDFVHRYAFDFWVPLAVG